MTLHALTLDCRFVHSFSCRAYITAELFHRHLQHSIQKTIGTMSLLRPNSVKAFGSLPRTRQVAVRHSPLSTRSSTIASSTPSATIGTPSRTHLFRARWQTAPPEHKVLVGAAAALVASLGVAAWVNSYDDDPILDRKDPGDKEALRHTPTSQVIRSWM